MKSPIIIKTEEFVDRELLAKCLKGSPNYAGYFACSCDELKQASEFGVVEQWASAYYGWDNIPFSELRVRGRSGKKWKSRPQKDAPQLPDPPDCDAIFETSKRWGFEVTELVNEQLRRDAGRLPDHPKYDESLLPHEYSHPELIDALQSIIRKKDVTPEKWHDGPYDRRTLIIFCDEDLPINSTQMWLSDHAFESTQCIQDAYLLLPPPITIHERVPSNEECVVIPLNFRP